MSNTDRQPMAAPDEQHDHHAHLVRGQQWLEKLLSLAGLAVRVEPKVHILPQFLDQASGAIEESEVQDYWLVIEDTHLSPEQIQALIGPAGTCLDAIQYLASATLNLGLPPGEQRAYTVELNGYRVRRHGELLTMTSKVLERVRQSGKEFELKALSSAERRQVHTFLQSCSDVETFSRGREPDRVLVVHPKAGPVAEPTAE